MRIIAALVVAVLSIASIAGQQPAAPAFEAVSIKVNDSGRDGGGATQVQLREMLQAMLRDRFRVLAHVEQRVRPIYNLVLARAAGQTGPSLRKSPITNCLDPAERAAAVAMTPPGRPCGFSAQPGNYSGAARLADLTTMLSGASGRTVFERTGLAGNYEFDLRWTALTSDTAPPDDAVSIFTDIQEQLGLKLESSTAPLDVLIVDRVERPSPNQEPRTPNRT